MLHFTAQKQTALFQRKDHAPIQLPLTFVLQQLDKKGLELLHLSSTSMDSVSRWAIHLFLSLQHITFDFTYYVLGICM